MSLKETNANFRILKVEGEEDLYTLTITEQVFDDNTQMTDISVKYFVAGEQLEHLKGVIDRVLMK